MLLLRKNTHTQTQKARTKQTKAATTFTGAFTATSNIHGGPILQK